MLFHQEPALIGLHETAKLFLIGKRNVKHTVTHSALKVVVRFDVEVVAVCITGQRNMQDCTLLRQQFQIPVDCCFADLRMLCSNSLINGFRIGMRLQLLDGF